jgi:ribosomal protein S18 acetylase RimI-like enzyme
LYDEAFSAKLRAAIPDDDARLRVLAEGLNLDRAIAAVQGDELVGIAGFHAGDTSLTGGITFGSIRRQVGLIKSLRAVAVFALLERRPAEDEMLMDGIVVRSASRGRGIGSRLFATLEDYARQHGAERIRLDVVDTNPGARRLYERLGFVATKTDRTHYLTRLMDFSASTTMVKHLN